VQNHSINTGEKSRSDAHAGEFRRSATEARVSEWKAPAD